MKLTFPKLSRPLKIGGCFLLLSPFIFGCLNVCSGVFGQAREEARQVACLSSMKSVALGLMMYAQDYDDHLPPASRWRDACGPHVSDAYRCPIACEHDPNAYGYAFNSLLSSKPLSRLKAQETIPILFDSDWLWRNAHAPGLISLANPGRHEKRNNIAYADGHAKSIHIPVDPAPPPVFLPAPAPRNK